ncbi:adventurous gliding motility lipoprotein CglD [Hyalangium gracile]|uniref:adventurous gliding motility lipoprotein CglD n=1 Tax=Hyalangium gracile TaxID=394092 RepID=UPI001CCB7274|nr:adventurous gliding motility lipoprotein CglD [Hyalangium gracile]
MNVQRLLYTALLGSVLATAAACGEHLPPYPHLPDAGTTDGGPTNPGPSDGGTTDGGTTDGGTTDGGTPNPGPTDGGTPDAGPWDAGMPDGGSDPSDPNNATKDTDCDGLSDKVEFETNRGDGRKTNPNLADTDQDGLPDGLELSVDTPVPGTTCTLLQDDSVLMNTDPTRPDTDGDGLLDGVEDASRNGKVDEGETNPLLLDSDCDGLIDGPTVSTTRGEDQNANGLKDITETDPRLPDTDGDGILDGVELGVIINPDPVTCTQFIPDVAPDTTTDPTDSDSDGDGVSDGAEDSNQNGGVDDGELDPTDEGDSTGPVGQVCAGANLRPVMFKAESGADIKLALPPSFAEVTPIQLGSDVRGMIGYDPDNKVAFLVYRQPAPVGASDALGDEEALRPAIASRGALSNRTAQRFKTWDGHDAVEAFYDQAGATTDLKRRTDELVNALLPGSTGRLSSAASGITGDFRLQTLFVHRSAQSLVVLVAVTNLAAVTGPNRNSVAAFSARDLSDGAALAQFGEPTLTQCERFQVASPTSSPKVDFLFVVDDSGSMAASQGALATTAQAVVDALNASVLDWRMAMVTSSYHVATYANTGRLRPFTRNVNKVKAWLTEGSTCTAGVCTNVPTFPEAATCPGDATQGSYGGCWVSVGGSGSEGVLGAARKAIDDITPGTPPTGIESPTQARQDASLVVVILGDADDQTSGATTTLVNCGTGGTSDRAGPGCESIQNFVNFFGSASSPTTPINKTGKRIPVHGIVCPAGSFCGCSSGPCDSSNTTREFNPQPGSGPQRHASVVNATGGVLGSILDANSIQASMVAITTETIANAGYKTLKPPIGVSIKVAMDAVSDPALCLASNVPRSTVNGFNFDGSAQTISLFGACRPPGSGALAVVSYQSWRNTVSDPNGGVPCEDDPNYSPTEPDHCVGPTLGCNATGDQCVCKPNCGNACASGTQCNMATCSCQ